MLAVLLFLDVKRILPSLTNPWYNYIRLEGSDKEPRSGFDLKKFTLYTTIDTNFDYYEFIGKILL